MVNPTKFVISFVDTTPDQANMYADDLRTEILSSDPSVKAKTARDSNESQDFGTTLVVVLGTSAVTALANGVARWIARNSGARILIKTDSGTLVADHVDSSDSAALVRAFEKLDREKL
jgi:hypothetical protein